MDKIVLVVEDDVDIQDYYQTILSDLGIAKILRAYNGKEALAIIDDQEKIDLIVLDLIMPVMNGTEFMRILRKERQSAIPVIVSTVDEISAANLQKVDGVQGYFSKLDNIDYFQAMIKEHCPD